MNSPEVDKSVYEKYALHIRPQITQQDDGTWRAQYPEADWYVTADTKKALDDKLGEEITRRRNAGEDATGTPLDILERHLAQPILGVYALDTELFRYLRQHKGVAETERAFEEAERRRALGQTYTKADYDREAAERDHRRG
ncbi:hypothetical protein [Mycobacterium sp.]|uniref:hypothetical protein n=1 Tax=Mycobacterium sp. TaxID=1785 RepID=UPI00127924EE|nr:hypothetical protein [Mycobacterium sp.]KAA8958681.1 MAG: hypothetical protein F6Q13_15260 [Mycobacterium sp.]